MGLQPSVDKLGWRLSTTSKSDNDRRLLTSDDLKAVFEAVRDARAHQAKAKGRGKNKKITVKINNLVSV